MIHVRDGITGILMAVWGALLPEDASCIIPVLVLVSSRAKVPP